MSNATQWIKNNVLHVICFVVMAVCAVAFFWPISAKGSAFVERMQKERQAVPNKIKALHRTPVEVPGPNINTPATTENWPVTPVIVDKLASIYKQREEAFKELYEYIVAESQRGHEPMLPRLFPTADSDGVRYNARTAYLDTIGKFYKDIRAGMPPSKEEVERLVQLQEDKFRQSYNVADQLSTSQLENLNERTAKELRTLYQERGNSFDLYADPRGAFQIGAWCESEELPSMFDIWEGQMQLWIQSDLIEAIRLTNDGVAVETTTVKQSDGSTAELPLGAKPIRRLLSMGVTSGYIGLDSRDPAAKTQAATLNISNPLPDNFNLTPTGRQSNALYDVRHAQLSVVIQSRYLPKLLNAIGQVNLMTVIGMEVRDINEYAELRNGYWYGKQDVVQANLSIETLWLRPWTAGHASPEEAKRLGEQFNPGLMPDSVRHYLGLKPRDPKFTPAQNQQLDLGGDNRRRR